MAEKKSKVPGPIQFPYAIKSFVGYLEGTHKAAHTIKNYRLDLLAFQKYLEERARQDGAGVELTDVSRDDLERYSDHLRTAGLKTNTRRRKLLTVQRFLGYLQNRNKLSDDTPRRFPAPHKIERIPFTVSSEALEGAIRALGSATVLEARNRVLLWTLAETGCLVSEVTRLRYDDWERDGATGPARVRISGKGARTLTVSGDLYEAVQSLQILSAGESDWMFLGFNKFGSLGAAITPRGVELLVRAYSERLGFPELTPRTFRHSAVLRWFQAGKSRKDIQEMLGLKTAYAFRVYEPLFAMKSREEAADTGAEVPENRA